jgi:hypothetical protein
VVAYGGNPAADLTVQIVPSGSVGNCGTPLGAAAADVQAAGFTTCARYNDFTTPIPNTVGTGLPNDWLNCTQNDTPAAVWYWSLNWIDTYGNALPCVSGPGANSSNSAVYQTIDPVAGGTVLDLRGGSSTCNPNAFNGHCTATINTIPYGAVDTYTAPNSGVYPNSYVEIVFREDTGTGINAGATYWYGNAEAVRNGLPSGNGIEMDMQECWGCTFWDTAIHRWTSTSGDLGPNQTFGAQFSQINPSQYHT